MFRHHAFQMWTLAQDAFECTGGIVLSYINATGRTIILNHSDFLSVTLVPFWRLPSLSLPLSLSLSLSLPLSLSPSLSPFLADVAKHSPEFLTKRA